MFLLLLVIFLLHLLFLTLSLSPLPKSLGPRLCRTPVDWAQVTQHKQTFTYVQSACSVTLMMSLLYSVNKGIGGPLPRPASPPPGLRSEVQQRHQVSLSHAHTCTHITQGLFNNQCKYITTTKHDDGGDVIPQPQVMVAVSSSIAVMRLSYEEVYAGTNGFSPCLQIGEGGFGVVYRATLKDMKCAVKKFKEVSQSQCSSVLRSFQTASGFQAATGLVQKNSAYSLRCSLSKCMHDPNRLIISALELES